MKLQTDPKLIRIWINFFNRLTIEALEALLELLPNLFSEKLFGEMNPANKTENIKSFIDAHKNLNEKQVEEFLNSLGEAQALLFLIAFSRLERNNFYEVLFADCDNPIIKTARKGLNKIIESLLGPYQIRYIEKLANQDPEKILFKMGSVVYESFYWDRINIKNTIKEELPNYEVLSEYMKMIGTLFYTPDLRADEEKDDEYNDRLEFVTGRWLDEHELGNIESHMKRYFTLIPPVVNVAIEIPEKVKELFAETRRCYVFGQFKASIALCRSVIEVSLKDSLKVGTINKDWSAGKCLTTALQNKIIKDQELYAIGDDINIKANRILHGGADLSEEEALYFLNNTKKYIELFYK
jgi:hypothetical protein